jgi:hypothetical protein
VRLQPIPRDERSSFTKYDGALLIIDEYAFAPHMQSLKIN